MVREKGLENHHNLRTSKYEASSTNSHYTLPIGREGIAYNVCGKHAGLRPDLHNDRVQTLLMTRTDCKGGPQVGASTFLLHRHSQPLLKSSLSKSASVVLAAVSCSDRTAPACSGELKRWGIPVLPQQFSILLSHSARTRKSSADREP